MDLIRLDSATTCATTPLDEFDPLTASQRKPCVLPVAQQVNPLYPLYFPKQTAVPQVATAGQKSVYEGGGAGGGGGTGAGGGGGGTGAAVSGLCGGENGVSDPFSSMLAFTRSNISPLKTSVESSSCHSVELPLTAASSKTWTTFE